MMILHLAKFFLFWHENHQYKCRALWSIFREKLWIRGPQKHLAFLFCWKNTHWLIIALGFQEVCRKRYIPLIIMSLVDLNQLNKHSCKFPRSNKVCFSQWTKIKNSIRSLLTLPNYCWLQEFANLHFVEKYRNTILRKWNLFVGALISCTYRHWHQGQLFTWSRLG